MDGELHDGVAVETRPEDLPPLLLRLLRLLLGTGITVAVALTAAPSTPLPQTVSLLVFILVIVRLVLVVTLVTVPAVVPRRHRPCACCCRRCVTGWAHARTILSCCVAVAPEIEHIQVEKPKSTPVFAK